MNFSWKCKTIFVVFLFIIKYSSADLEENNICGGEKRELVAHPKNCSLYYKCSQKQVSSLNACQSADSKWLHEDSDKNDDKKQNKYLPKSISIKLPTGKQTTTQLNLAKKPNSTDNLVILCNTRGRVEKWVASENETWSVYSDLKTESSISVATRIEGGKKKLIYDGSFVANKTRYSLRPNEGKRSYPLDPNKTKFISLNDTTYILTEENYTAGQYDFVRAEQSGPANVTSVMTDLEKLVNAQLQSTSSQRRYGLELFIVLDYSIFYK
ncbi:hypothetical protein HELRODRAFT_163019 [Helobdella robusta]|uniref:Uncharacterized protein n=1 Tax=Helobdella robusta TaxID=6412 RepID=T1ETK7_HELRO|nr:hypothetical protein HELRODRAFT_163019 [Helobdella robusta]ESN99469.1 hypothetical protein HELRODRAFT_163019 [Helobdella robusta]